MDPTTAGQRLRAAQIAVIARYSPAMLAVNLFNGFILWRPRFSLQSEPTTTFVWLASLLAHACLSPAAFTGGAHKSPPATVGPKAVRRAAQCGRAGRDLGPGRHPVLRPDRACADRRGLRHRGHDVRRRWRWRILPQAVVASATPGLTLGSFVAPCRAERTPWATSPRRCC
ncbi:MAG: hypothetical protein U1E30_03140 [Rhodoblastus sp.]